MEKQLNGASSCQTVTCSQVGVKEESDGDSTAGHLHRFQVKFSSTHLYEYTIECDQPCTVLEAITLTENFKKKMNCSDENIVIQLGRKDKNYIFPTHFPCSCIRRGESLILSYKSEEVEAAQDQQDNTIQPRHKYSVFYTDTVGGLYTKQKKLFRNNAVKKYLCVYGEKGMTVEEGQKRDGRFIDDLSNFELSDNENPRGRIKSRRKVVFLHKKKLKVCLPRRKRKNYERNQEKPGVSKNPPQKRYRGIKPLGNVVKQRGMSVRAAMKEKNSKVSDEEIYEELRQQSRFPADSYQRAPYLELMESRVLANYYNRAPYLELMESRFLANYYNKALELQLMESRVLANYYNREPYLELMESRFRVDYFQKALDLKKENFGNNQRSSVFSEVHRVRKMIKLGESVCKVVVENGDTGTGFVLFDNYILTNAHILKDCFEGEKLKPGIDVYALFNYDDPEPDMNYYCFQAHCEICYIDDELDYAILGLNVEGQNPSTQTNEINISLPPGLLKIFGEAPTTGEACLIGHPAGELKKIEYTCIIGKENREQAVIDHFRPYKDKRFVDHTINELKERGIENIMIGRYKADKVTTYKTCMYDGASGSPVFDAHGNVFGLHTGGYVYGEPFLKESVIEYAQPVLTIFEHLVNMMIEKENVQSLLRFREEAQRNSKLYEVFEFVLKGSRYEALLWSVDSDEPMDTN